jgi:hypothetical protein
MGIPKEFRESLAEAKRAFAAVEYINHFTPNEAAKFLNRRIETLARWRKQGIGPEWKRHSDGRHILYPFDPLVDWVVYKQKGMGHRFTRFDKPHRHGFMTEREAGEFLGVSQSTMVNWRKAGIVQGHQARSRFNLGGTLHFYKPIELIRIKWRIKPRRGLGRGKGSAGRFMNAMEDRELTLDDF